MPVYELVASVGPIHEPMFEYSVKAREYTATGRGCHFCVNCLQLIHTYTLSSSSSNVSGLHC